MTSRSLLNCALNKIIKLIVSCPPCHVDSKEFCQLASYFSSIPTNLWDVWSDLLLKGLEARRGSHARLLTLGVFLTEVDADRVLASYSPHWLAMLMELLPGCCNLKVVRVKHSSFFWKADDFRNFGRTVLPCLSNLRQLTLHMICTNDPNYFRAASEGCPWLEVLDISNLVSLPPANYNAIASYFPNLKVLLVRQTLDWCTSMGRDSVRCILTQAKGLQIFEDSTPYWSCILPVLSELSAEGYTGPVIPLEHLTVHKTAEVSPDLVANIRQISLESRIIHQADPATNIWGWLQKLPSLHTVNLQLRDLRCFSTAGDFLSARHFLRGPPVRSLTLADSQLSFRSLIYISQCLPELEHLQILNITATDDMATLNEDTTYFSNLSSLSFTGSLDERLASILLSNCSTLKQLKLHTSSSVPTQFLSQNRLASLSTLELDSPDATSMAASLVAIAAKSATSLRTVHLRCPSCSSQLKLLAQQLCNQNKHLQITF